MPDRRIHRGAHPEDSELFAPQVHASLRRAVADLSWLLRGGYADQSSLKLVGDRYQLKQRQRIAVMRSACSDQAQVERKQREVNGQAMNGASLVVDGYNLLTTIEAALAGGVLLLGRDGCVRDMASMHGSYRKVSETLPALERIGRHLQQLGVAETVWQLDSPVSNSGRLKTMMEQIAGQRDWAWRIQLLPNPDASLVVANQIVVTADSAVLDRCGGWLNLARSIVLADAALQKNLVDLSDGPVQ